MEGNFLEICNLFKNKIKKLSEGEKKYLKSISFSIIEDKLEFVIYFTWNQSEYDKYYSERDIFRENIRSELIRNGFRFNMKKSNPAKYIFKYG